MILLVPIVISIQLQHIYDLNWNIVTVYNVSHSCDVSLAEASLFVREFANQLPEFQKRQLSIIICIQWAHELVNHCRIIGILHRANIKIESVHVPYKTKKEALYDMLSEHSNTMHYI